MQRRRLSCWIIAAAAVVPACAEVPILPSAKHLHAADGAPIIGRVRMRDQTLDLTRTSVAEGGPAGRLGPGVAEIMADVDRDSRDVGQGGAFGASREPGALHR